MKILQSRRCALLLIFFCCSAIVFSQTQYTFTKGLAIANVHQYGREALYKDVLAQALYAGKLDPKEGAAIGSLTENTSSVWKPIDADTSGVFRSTAMGNGYLHLTYASEKATVAVLRVTGHSMLYFNGAPHAGDMYRYGWMQVPVQLKKGTNEILIRSSGMGRFAAIAAKLEFPKKSVAILSADPTLPFFVEGEEQESLWAGIVLLNAQAASLKDMKMKAVVGGKSITTDLPAVIPMMSRKVPVRIPVPDAIKKGSYPLHVELFQGNKLVDTATFVINAVTSREHASYTFISKIDGSVQYFAVAPQTQVTQHPSLFFSVHGAEVEAISQARAYAPKAEGPVVAPTNRRPRGFNWEDWGRMDALEVLDIAKQRYQPDPQRIYLTGHSMGGHGTWYLGATYAGQWAAIAPCAGYPTMADYGSHDGRVPTEAATDVRKMLIRSGNPGNTLKLAKNYKAGGVYIFHGDADPTVSVEYARQMKKVLADFHPDFSYYEYPGGSHWFGNESVDWPPIFDYFKLHTIPLGKNVNEIDFTTASVAISSRHHWVTILQQHLPYQFSNIQLKRDLKLKTIKGKTENIERIQIGLSDFNPGETVALELDAQLITEIAAQGKDLVLIRQEGKWVKSTNAEAKEKGLVRNGGLKEAFRNQMVFVYGTNGTAEENAWMLNKARFDAETWYYRGNGAVDIISDKEYDPARYAGRGIVLYGNNSINTAAAMLMKDCPVSIERGLAKVGSQEWKGGDLGSYHVWPDPNATHASIALIGGTGIRGMRAAEANQYYAGGSGFPDFMIFSLDMLSKGESGLKAAGYFNNQWELGKDVAFEK